MIFRIFFIVLLYIVGIPEIQAQNDTANVQSIIAPDTMLRPVDTQQIQQRVIVQVDSAVLAQAKHIRDSLIWFYLKPDPTRKSLFVDSMLKKHISTDYTFLTQAQPKATKIYETGKELVRYPTWEIIVLLLLIIAFAVLKIGFSKQMKVFFHAFYDDRAFVQINKEENVFSSWYFLASYVLYSLFAGFFIYILFERFAVEFTVGKFSSYLFLSLLFSGLIGLKILLLRFIGYFFQFQRLTREYINSIYLSFFNISLFFIPIVICFTLSINNNNWILWSGLLIFLLAALLQMIRISVHILSNYKLSKFYLILYICAFELCPVVILIKALNNI